MKISKKDLPEKTEQIYDVIIVGGGAGGLSAGIYSQRYLLSTLIIDKGKARSFWMQSLNNYLGLPPETPGRELLKKGQDHYLSLNGDMLNGFVEEITEEGDYFLVKTKVGRQNSEYPVFKAKYIIAASGIIDYLPTLDNMKNVFDYAGYNLHVCMICDGYEMRDTKCGLFAGSEQALNIVNKLRWFTSDIVVFTQGAFEMSDNMRNKLEKLGFPVYETEIKQFLGENHHMSGVELVDGTIVELENGLISMGSRYHNTYLTNFDLEMKGGNLITDQNGRTSHPRIFAIGDLKVGINQVVEAAGDGALAATAIWHAEVDKFNANI